MHACKKCAKEALVMVPISDRYTAVTRPVASSNCHEHVRKLHDVWNILQTWDSWKRVLDFFEPPLSHVFTYKKSTDFPGLAFKGLKERNHKRSW